MKLYICARMRVTSDKRPAREKGKFETSEPTPSCYNPGRFRRDIFKPPQCLHPAVSNPWLLPDRLSSPLRTDAGTAVLDWLQLGIHEGSVQLELDFAPKNMPQRLPLLRTLCFVP